MLTHKTRAARLRSARIAALTLLMLTPATWAENPSSSPEILDEGIYQTQNGTLFSYSKTVAEGEERIAYTDGSSTLSHEELLTYEQANPRPKVEEELLEQAIAMGSEELDLVVWLTDRPGAPGVSGFGPVS